MKRLLPIGLAACLMTAATTPAAAQSMFGLSAGVTYSKLSGNYFVSGTEESRWGFMFGGNFAWALSSFAAVRLEANWTQKGGKGTTSFGAEPVEMIMNYLEAPLVLTLGTALTPTVVLGAHGGIAFGYRTDCKVKIDGGSSQSCFSTTITLNEDRQSWSVPVGVTLGVNVGGATLFLDGRYSLGLSNLSRVPDTELKANGLQGIVRLGFPIR